MGVLVNGREVIKKETVKHKELPEFVDKNRFQFLWVKKKPSVVVVDIIFFLYIYILFVFRGGSPFCLPWQYTGRYFTLVKSTIQKKNLSYIVYTFIFTITFPFPQVSVVHWRPIELMMMISCWLCLHCWNQWLMMSTTMVPMGHFWAFESRCNHFFYLEFDEEAWWSGEEWSCKDLWWHNRKVLSSRVNGFHHRWSFFQLTLFGMSLVAEAVFLFLMTVWSRTWVCCCCCCCCL